MNAVKRKEQKRARATRPNTSFHVICTLFLVLATSPVSLRAQEARFDGHWWRSASYDEQAYFIEGYLDCYAFEFKGPKTLSGHSYDAIQNFISTFYEKNPKDLDKPAAEVLFEISSKPREKRPAVDDGNKPRPHFGNDGDAWSAVGLTREGYVLVVSKTQDRRLGFIEGYLYCHRHDANNRGGTFSKSARDYVRLINKWYRINDEAGEIDEKREGVMIADVLFKFRDREPPAPHPAPPIPDEKKAVPKP